MRCLLVLIAGCSSALIDDADPMKPYGFSAVERSSMPLDEASASRIAQPLLNSGETVASAHALRATGLGQNVTEVVATTGTDTRAFVVTESGAAFPTDEFFEMERDARRQAFGKLEPALFDSQSALPDTAMLRVAVTVNTDVPLPQLPFDGTDKSVPVEQFESWFAGNAAAQMSRIDASKQPVLTMLSAHGAANVYNPHALPRIVADVPVSLLRSELLNTSSSVIQVTQIDSGPHALMGYAGWASMNQQVLTGGVNCTGLCDGGNIDVGLWENDDSITIHPGIALNNSRFSTLKSVTNYLHAPPGCGSDADCQSTDVDAHHCVQLVASGPHVCVQEHLTWVAAALGMYGSYDYSTIEPTHSPDPERNVPVGTSFGSMGAWRADIKVGNDNTEPGLDYLLASQGANSPPTPFINRSASNTPDFANWPGFAYGTFIAVAAGNNGNSESVQCNTLKNGMCVGWFDYHTYNDLSSHRRTHVDGSHGSDFVNPLFDYTLERPHLLGPGNQDNSSSGLHMPATNVAPGIHTMLHSSFETFLTTPISISGSSFASPAIVGAAAIALQYEGWFSALAFPMVNKAVLLAGSQDANADGDIGKSTVWSSQPSDAEDGAGQINFSWVKQILDNNQYFERDLQNSDFVSCGTNCRQYTVGTVALQPNKKLRVAMAWHECMQGENSVILSGSINNDLDLVVDGGNPIVICGGAVISSAVSSEVEMVEVTCGPSGVHNYAIKIRVKNGVALHSCGSTSTERVGVAWSTQ